MATPVTNTDSILSSIESLNVQENDPIATQLGKLFLGTIAKVAFSSLKFIEGIFLTILVPASFPASFIMPSSYQNLIDYTKRTFVVSYQLAKSAFFPFAKEENLNSPPVSTLKKWAFESFPMQMAKIAGGSINALSSLFAILAITAIGSTSSKQSVFNQAYVLSFLSSILLQPSNEEKHFVFSISNISSIATVALLPFTISLFISKSFDFPSTTFQTTCGTALGTAIAVIAFPALRSIRNTSEYLIESKLQFLLSGVKKDPGEPLGEQKSVLAINSNYKVPLDGTKITL